MNPQLLQIALNMLRLGYTTEIVACALVTHEAVSLQQASQIASAASNQWLALLGKNIPLPPLDESVQANIKAMITRPMPKGNGAFYTTKNEDSTDSV